MEAEREAKEEMGKRRTRKEEKEENETVIVKRVVVILGVIFLMVLVGCDSLTWTRLLVVNDVLVSPSSAVAEMCEGVSSDSDGEIVDRIPFLQKALVCLCGESMRDEL